MSVPFAALEIHLMWTWMQLLLLHLLSQDYDGTYDLACTDPQPAVTHFPVLDLLAWRTANAL